MQAIDPVVLRCRKIGAGFAASSPRFDDVRSESARDGAGFVRRSVIDNQHLITWPQGFNRPRDAACVIVSVEYGGNAWHEILNPLS